VHFGFVRHEAGQHPAEPECLVRELGADPPVPACRHVPFGEDEVDDPQHGTEPRPRGLRPRGLERDLSSRERAFGPHDALLHGRDGQQHQAGDLVGGQPGDHAQGQGHLRLPREHGVARGEDQPQHIVVDRLPLVVADLLQLLRHRPVPLVDALAAAPRIDGTPLGDGREPGARVARHGRLRPPDQGFDQRRLSKILGQREVARHPGEPTHDAGPLDTPDRIDLRADVGHDPRP
jgi:hypothetical protein